MDFRQEEIRPASPAFTHSKQLEIVACKCALIEGNTNSCHSSASGNSVGHLDFHVYRITWILVASQSLGVHVRETLPHIPQSNQLVWSIKKIWHLAKLRNPQTNFPHQCSHHMDERPGLLVRDNRRHIPGEFNLRACLQVTCIQVSPILYFSRGLFLSLTKGSLTTILGEANVATATAAGGFFGPSLQGLAGQESQTHLNRSNQQEGGHQVTN